MSGSVRAAVATAVGAPLSVVDLELPPLGPDDVRVRLAAAGVCHSDLSFADGTLAGSLPMVLGHEAAGTVVAAGDHVEGVAAGDPVVLNWAPACRTCWFCARGEPWLCARAERPEPRTAGRLPDGTGATACLGVGAFAEQVVVAADAVVPLPAGVPLDLAALLGCAVLTGVGAACRTAGVRGGESVLVVGLGGVGLSAVAGARIAGAGQIIAADVAVGKEDLARRMGATEFVVSDDQLPRRVRSLTAGRGVDHALECVGRATTIRAAWQATRRGGRCTVVGVGRRDDPVTFGALELFHFARTLTGSVFGSGDPVRDLPWLAELVRSGQLDLAALATHTVDLSGVDGAFERMRAGVGGRTLVRFAD